MVDNASIPRWLVKLSLTSPFVAAHQRMVRSRWRWAVHRGGMQPGACRYRLPIPGLPSGSAERGFASGSAAARGGGVAESAADCLGLPAAGAKRTAAGSPVMTAHRAPRSRPGGETLNGARPQRTVEVKRVLGGAQARQPCDAPGCRAMGRCSRCQVISVENGR